MVSRSPNAFPLLTKRHILKRLPQESSNFREKSADKRNHGNLYEIVAGAEKAAKNVAGMEINPEMPKGPKGHHPTIWVIDAKLAVPVRKKLNAAQRRDLKAASVQLFAKKYARKAQKGRDPNDRQYDRSVEQQVRQMKPEELYRLLRYGEDD